MKQMESIISNECGQGAIGLVSGKTLATTSLDESQIREVLATVLDNSKVTPRKKNVKKWLRSNQSRAEIGGLLSRYGLDSVSRVAMAILQQRVAGSSKSLSESTKATEGGVPDSRTGDSNSKDEGGSAEFDHQRVPEQAGLSSEIRPGDKVGSDRTEKSRSDEN